MPHLQCVETLNPNIYNRCKSGKQQPPPLIPDHGLSLAKNYNVMAQTEPGKKILCQSPENL